jgi:limonene-1,2-epoxide hydrolase
MLAVLLASCVMALNGGRTLRAQGGGSPQNEMSAREQAALDVVKGWISGWLAKDPEKVASYMDEDVFWAGGFPDNPLFGIWRGRDRYIQQDGPFTRIGVKFTMAEVLAVGGSRGTAILHRRIDEGGIDGYEFGAARGTGGQGMWFTNAVFFWVTDGKIKVWLDAPASPNTTRDQAPPLSSFAVQEQPALELVKNWVAAWNARYPVKVASYMSDDAQYSAYYPQYITEIGKAHFLETHGPNIRTGVDMRIVQSLAVGSSRGVGVLLRRIDRFSVGGHQVEVPTAAFYWVVNGKIHTWLDLPLEPPPTTASGTVVVR